MIRWQAAPDPKEIVERIETQGLNWQHCVLPESKRQRGLLGWRRPVEQTFFVSSDEADVRFLEAIVCLDDWLSVSGYLPNPFVECSDVRALGTDWLGQNEGRCHAAVKIDLSGYQTMLWIGLDPYRYPVAQMIERVQAVAERHGKTLEVCL